MNTRRIGTIILAAVTVAVFTFSGFALAQGSGRGAGRGRSPQAWARGEGPRGGIERLAERLDLTEDQVKTVTAIQAEARANNQELRKELLRLRNQLQGELLKDAPDAKAAADLVGKIGDLRTKMQQNRLQARLAVRQQLTPEQRDKMLLTGGGFGRGERFGRGGRGHGCGHGPGDGSGRDCPRRDD